MSGFGSWFFATKAYCLLGINEKERRVKITQRLIASHLKSSHRDQFLREGEVLIPVQFKEAERST